MGEDRTFLLDALSCRSKLQLPAYLWLTLFERGYELHRKTSTEDENAVGRSGITFTIGPDGKATQVVVEISMCAAKELSSGFQIRRRQQVRLADEPCYFSFASDDAKSMTTRPKTFARRKSRSRSDAPSFGFTSSELRTLRALKSPAGIQRFLDQLPYNLSFTARSPQKVLRDRTASCLEGGIFAAAALCVIGFPPLIFDLEAEQDTDHVVAIFKVRGHWGAVAKSNFTGCRYREPVYRNLRELAMSYFNVYFNLRGERTLRRYSRPVNLARFDRLDWMTTEKPIWFIAEHLCEIPHISLLTPPMEKRLTRVDRRTFKGEMVGHRK